MWDFGWLAACYLRDDVGLIVSTVCPCAKVGCCPFGVTSLLPWVPAHHRPVDWRRGGRSYCRSSTPDTMATRPVAVSASPFSRRSVWFHPRRLLQARRILQTIRAVRCGY